MKRRKDYSITQSVISLGEQKLADINPLKLNFTDGYGRLIQSFDFSEFSSRPLMTKHIIEAFRETQAAAALMTRRSNFGGVRNWFRFLDEATVKVTDINDLSTDLIKEYVQWINRHDWSLKTKHREYHSVKPLFLWLKRKHGLDNLEVVTNAYPGVNDTTQPPEKLNEAELASVLRAARAEIRQTWKDFQKGQSLLADYTL